MIEFKCEILTWDENSINVKLENGYYDVIWGETSFKFPYCFLCDILKNFFLDQKWYLLGSNLSDDQKGLGNYIIENPKSLSKSLKHVSAIASIMVELGLIEFRELNTRGRPIELRRI